MTPDGNVYLIERYDGFLAFSYGRRSPDSSYSGNAYLVYPDGFVGFDVVSHSGVYNLSYGKEKVSPFTGSADDNISCYIWITGALGNGGLYVDQYSYGLSPSTKEANYVCHVFSSGRIEYRYNFYVDYSCGKNRRTRIGTIVLISQPVRWSRLQVQCLPFLRAQESPDIGLPDYASHVFPDGNVANYRNLVSYVDNSYGFLCNIKCLI